jgi:hypothetical protein
MKILLVWNEVPEALRFFGFSLDENSEQLSTLETANELYINSTGLSEKEEQALDCIHAAISKPEHCKFYNTEGQSQVPESWFSLWNSSEIPANELPNSGGFDRVFSCGFLL